ncbi:MAG: DNA primase noncatalytic subunit PriX [Crenarchaeota archaeon]|nr:DNA primase noncatalytic subunit PriX [Thermoproteota archaeon]
MDPRLKKLIDACNSSIEECREALDEFLSSMCEDPSECETPRGKRRLIEKYAWVDKVIEKGVPDGRSRLILYVISRYLVNVKNLSVEDAHLTIKQFIDSSCRNFNNCSKIYDSWIRNVLKSVAQGKWLPWNLDKLRDRDPELYDIVASLLEE